VFSAWLYSWHVLLGQHVGDRRRIVGDGAQPLHLARLFDIQRVELAHAGTDHVGQAPAHRSFGADFVERDAEHQYAGIGFECAVFDMPADLIPLGVEIEHHQQLADLPHQRADHGFFPGAQIAALSQLARNAARQQRAVQFEFRVDPARRAVMKVIDDFQADHQMADRVHAEHH
jgi:hypothetical protein